jgi:protein-S-isoprenylcysteine O-methyltransferase Ste14
MLISVIIWISWFGSEVALSLIVRSGKKDQKNRDKNSLRVIWIIIALAVTAGVTLANRTHFFIGQYAVIHYTGLAVIVAGMLLRFISIYTLGRMFTVDVTIRADHKLKTDGLYKIIRHPSYTGSLLSFAGFGLSLNNWLSLITVFVLVTAAFMYRIRVEEQLLAEGFGKEYEAYKKSTSRLIPWIY